ncbi:MAG: ATP-dependent zinc metalloprotease FtsH [Actinobacteria bacterium]|nr:ATP-dependent zinc metalloprotease FtsH [Actinomycetota bacterium]
MSLLVTAVLLFVLFTQIESGDDATALSYSAFLEQVDAGAVATAEIHTDGSVEGELVATGVDVGTEAATETAGEPYTTTVPVGLAGDALLDRLEAHGVVVTAVVDTPSGGTQLLGWLFALLPFVVLAGVWVWIARRAKGGGGAGGAMTSAFGMGRSKVTITDPEHPTTTFTDVAGYDGVKREVAEIIEFLREPTRFAAAGAVAPRGVLMTGPPGTGKTLLARAVAGEAGVPFLSVTGSSFVEMFVGVGAARVRDLFAAARKLAPAIIFVDEIDAIGQRRQSGAMVSNDEREQTLNQLLSEMDGFDPAAGIIVLAATNRPEVLDAALLRPGRFDRQVTIPLPNQSDRVAILRVHCRGKQLSPDIDLDTVARGTPGFSGADLANLANEAAIRAARERRSTITPADVEDARDRILIGQRDASNVLLPEERRAVAVHEAGHALVAACSDHADPVHKVTILPAGMALGVTHQLPLHERHLYSESYLRDTLAVQLAGRVAERMVFGEGSTGAANDLATATSLATKMVREYGLSPELGPVGYPSGGALFLTGGPEVSTRPFGDDTQRHIDLEVARLVREAETQAGVVLAAHRDALDRIVFELLEHETLDGPAVYDLAHRTMPVSRPQVLTHRAEPSVTSMTSAPSAPSAPSVPTDQQPTQEDEPCHSDTTVTSATTDRPAKAALTAPTSTTNSAG